jgi:hypothetical protein
VTCGVTISCIERCHKRGRKRKVRAFKANVGSGKLFSGLPLPVIKLQEPLERKCWEKECRNYPEGIVPIAVNEKRYEGDI